MAGINRDCLITKIENEQNVCSMKTLLDYKTPDVFIEDSSVTASRLVFTR
jgi:hypothetical protein